MSGKVARPRKYEIPYVGFGIEPVPLGIRENDEIRRTLKRRPTDAFVSAYCMLLAHYIAHRATIRRSSPAAVQTRLEIVLRNATGLQEGLNHLELVDEMYFGRFARKHFLKKEPYTGLGPLSEAISGFLPLINEVIADLKGGENRGRPPAYADQALASSLRRILFDETGKHPTARRDGMFACLLQNAFTHASRLNTIRNDDRSPKPRKDVYDLMRFALKDPPQPLLPYFKNVDKQGPAEKIVLE